MSLSPEQEERFREIAREEAHQVYDDISVVDTQGNEHSITTLQQRISALFPDLDRRETLKLGIVAFGYVASGAAVGTAILNAVSQPAAADAVSADVGTQADPYNKGWFHHIGAGDGATEVTFDDPIVTDDIVDGGGISHTGRLADLGEVFLASYATTVGGGSITNNSGVVELREPGNASATSESRLYSHIFEFDPSVSRLVRIEVSNITIDDSQGADILLAIGSNPDTAGVPGDDGLGVFVEGSGRIRAFTETGGTNSTTNDTSQDNAYVSGLQTIEISWDGSIVTATTDDGSTTVTVSDNGQYPTASPLFLKVAATDTDASNARNSDFDLDTVVIDE